jgi:putative membrane protein
MEVMFTNSPQRAIDIGIHMFICTIYFENSGIIKKFRVQYSFGMTTEIFFRYIHFISIFAVVSSLVSEHLLLKKELTRAELTRIARIDAVYGLAALTLLAAGLTLWFGGVGKPAVFYSKNWIFHTKITCFLIVALLSIYPTVFFLRNRKGNPAESVVVPNSVFWFLRLELTLLFIIPLLAGLMARGVGYFG